MSCSTTSALLDGHDGGTCVVARAFIVLGICFGRTGLSVTVFVLAEPFPLRNERWVLSLTLLQLDTHPGALNLVRACSFDPYQVEPVGCRGVLSLGAPSPLMHTVVVFAF